MTTKASTALLLIDWINDLEFNGGTQLLPRALKAARATARLRRRAKTAGIPVIYCNDNFGRWRSDFRQTLEHCLRDDVRGKPLAEILRPQKNDYFVLKPKHSGFHSTTLELLLEYLGARTLILTGIAGNMCVMFTAHDAHMRDYRIHVPRDCIASESEEDDQQALDQMEKSCSADTRPSWELALGKRRTSGTRREGARGKARRT